MHKMKALLSSVDVKGLKDAADNFCQLDWAFRILSTRNCPSLMQLAQAASRPACLDGCDGGLTLYTLIAGIIYAWTGFEKDATEQSWIWQMVQPKKKCWRRESLWLERFWGYFTTFDILDTVVYRCKGKVDLEWEQHIWNSCFFSPSRGVLAASGKKE